MKRLVLTSLGGRESVCKIICAIGDCLDTSGRLEDLPGGLLISVFGELTENLTRRRNVFWRKCDHLTRSAVPGQQTVESCACLKTVARSQFCTSEMFASPRVWHGENNAGGNGRYVGLPCLQSLPVSYRLYRPVKYHRPRLLVTSSFKECDSQQSVFERERNVRILPLV